MKEISFISLNPEWIRKPENVTITNDNAPVYQIKTNEKFFLLL